MVRSMGQTGSLYLGFDVGTQSTKALVIDADRRTIVAVAGVGRGERPAAGRHDQRRRAVQELQRALVEVVVVKVRDEDRVESARGLLGDRWPVPAQVGQPLPKDRVGQQPRPGRLDQDGRVAEKGRSVAAQHDRLRSAAR